MLRTSIVACCLLWVLGGCGRHDDAAAQADGTATDDAGLPKPAPAGGSVTGMPARPGPGQIGAPAAGLPPTDTASPIDGNNDAAIAGEDASGDADETSTGGDVQMPAEPTPADAAAVIRDITARSTAWITRMPGHCGRMVAAPADSRRNSSPMASPTPRT